MVNSFKQPTHELIYIWKSFILMGNSCSDKGASKQKYQKKLEILLLYESYFENNLFKHLSQSSYNHFSIISGQDQEIKALKNILNIKSPLKISQNLWQKFSQRNNRAIACFLGLAICDALGASTQFLFFKAKRSIIKKGFSCVKEKIKEGELKPRHGQIGIWTDDCSMALAIADSLILNSYKFFPEHIRFMFHMWLYHGLNNGGRDFSIGLGGNIKISMDQFCENRSAYTKRGDKFNNGNGSLMRLAPIPICFSNSQKQTLEFSQKQSLTTHNGDEARQCSKLLGLILYRLINKDKSLNWKQTIQIACSDYCQISSQQSVKCLARSQKQSQEIYLMQLSIYKEKFKKFNLSIQDRNWNWKDPNFTYSPCRQKHNPSYVGSYCMDALSMALHTVWFEQGFKNVALRNANMGGDCDTVGAIAGQIAGAIYGISPQMIELYLQMEDVKSKQFNVFLKAYKLLRLT